MFFFFVRRKNFEKNEKYIKAFKSSDDGTLSTQPGNIRIISLCDKCWEGGGGYWTVVQEVAMSDWAGSFYCVLCKVYQYSGFMVTTYNTF